MSRVVLDGSILAKLQDAGTTVEICDTTGRVRDHYVPAIAPAESDLEPQVSEEELDRRERAGGGRPLKAILADLEKRA